MITRSTGRPEGPAASSLRARRRSTTDPSAVCPCGELLGTSTSPARVGDHQSSAPPPRRAPPRPASPADRPARPPRRCGSRKCAPMPARSALGPNASAEPGLVITPAGPEGDRAAHDRAHVARVAHAVQVDARPRRRARGRPSDQDGAAKNADDVDRSRQARSRAGAVSAPQTPTVDLVARARVPGPAAAGARPDPSAPAPRPAGPPPLDCRRSMQVHPLDDEEAPLPPVLLLLELAGQLDAVVLPARRWCGSLRPPRECGKRPLPARRFLESAPPAGDALRCGVAHEAAPRTSFTRVAIAGERLRLPSGQLGQDLAVEVDVRPP